MSLWLTYQVSDGLKVCIYILQHWSVPSSQEMGHFRRAWPLGIFIELGMALNILSSPSLGNGIGSDFQNKWKMHLYANPFSLQVGVGISKTVPDMDFSKIVPDILQLLKLCTWWTRLNCCFCYAEYIVESMCHSLRTQMFVFSGGFLRIYFGILVEFFGFLLCCCCSSCYN